MRAVVDIPTWPRLFIPVMTGFGLAPNSTVQITLSAEKPCPNAFVVLMNDAQFRPRGLRFMPLLNRANDVFGSYSPSAWRASLASPINITYRTRGIDAELYYLGVWQGTPGAAENVKGATSYESPSGNQLPAQQIAMLSVMPLVAWAFFGSAILLALMVLVRRRSRSKLHALLLSALVLKFLVLLLMRDDIVKMSFTGRASVARQVLWQVLRQMQLAVEVLIFYVIGLGWKVMRSHLRPSEWAFCGTIAGLSFLLGLFEVACNTFASCGSQSYLLTQFTLHSFCFLVVIIATNFNVFTLQRQIADALATPETGTLYAKHRAYYLFRGLFLYFVIIPALVNILVLHVVRWDELWIIWFVREGSLWIVYTGVMWLFRPGPKQLRVFELAVVESSDSGSDISAE